MTIVDLIQKAGLANIKTQVVSRDLVEAKILKKSARVTFATSEEMASSIMREASGIAGDYYGIVVWIPRTEADRLREETK